MFVFEPPGRSQIVDLQEMKYTKRLEENGTFHWLEPKNHANWTGKSSEFLLNLKLHISLGFKMSIFQGVIYLAWIRSK